VARRQVAANRANATVPGRPRRSCDRFLPGAQRVPDWRGRGSPGAGFPAGLGRRECGGRARAGGEAASRWGSRNGGTGGARAWAGNGGFAGRGDGAQDGRGVGESEGGDRDSAEEGFGGRGGTEEAIT
jgi:hypothetical protein